MGKKKNKVPHKTTGNRPFQNCFYASNFLIYKRIFTRRFLILCFKCGFQWSPIWTNRIACITEIVFVIKTGFRPSMQIWLLKEKVQKKLTFSHDTLLYVFFCDKKMPEKMKLTYKWRFLASNSLVSSRSTCWSQPHLIIQFCVYFIQNISHFS